MHIGVFDSGLGGLTVLRELDVELPNYSYIYLGDNKNVPYGGRSQEEIYNLTMQGVDYLFSQNCKLVLLACNTATAAALRRLQQEYLPAKYPDRRILGVIRPVLEDIVSRGYKKVGVLATEATVSSKSFEREIGKLSKNVKLQQVACPGLVDLIEKGELRSLRMNKLVDIYLAEVGNDCDAVVLGCTHYGLIMPLICQKLPRVASIIESGPLVADKLKDYLHRHPEIQSDLTAVPRRRYLFTHVTPEYKDLIELFLGKKKIRNSIKEVALD